jgi:hypothetical protein
MTRQQSLDLQLGGMLREDGSLERTFGTTRLLLPVVVDIEGDQLVWQHAVEGDDSRRPKLATVDKGFLNDFIALADAPDEQIAAYARKWGVLGVCSHGCARTHPPHLGATGMLSGHCTPLGWEHCAPPERAFTRAHEPLQYWRCLARQARGMLQLASALHRGVASHPDIWDDLQLGPEQTSMGRSESTGWPNFFLTALVNQWLVNGDVRPHFAWNLDGAGPAVTLGVSPLPISDDFLEALAHLMPDYQGTSLFGALAVQLLLACSRAEGLAICSSCGTPYVPPRRPSASRHRFCTKCGVRASWRMAASKRRARQKKSKRRRTKR